jgi:transposase
MAPGNRNQPKRARSSESTYTVIDFTKDFPDDAHCLEYLWRRHYGLDDEGHAHCPKCEEIRRFHRVASRPSYSCDSCGHHIHPTAGTIMHKSSTSLHLWFHAIFLMAQTRCGISAKQLERELGVTYKTAWRMFTLIRNELMGEDTGQLSGSVEADEMYVGGKPRLADQRTPEARVRHRNSKTMVFGAVERGGKVQARVIPSNHGHTLQAEVVKTVVTGSTLYTDQAKQYHSIGEKGYDHHAIDHSAKVYVDGDVHTQTIDGFWSLVKRGISGTHHAVSPKWLQGYLNEYVWRYNRRDDSYPMFLNLLEQVSPRPSFGSPSPSHP